MIQYTQFYRQFGVRNADQLIRPPLPMVGRFQLPPLSLVHYPGSGPMDPGPNDQGLMYQHNTRPLRIEHVFNFASTLGNPKRIQADTASEVRKFREKNPRFRPMLDLDVQRREDQVIGTYNYAFLMRMFRFQRTMFTLQNRWTNVIETMFKKIGENISSGYNQYLEFNVPDFLPTPSNLDKAANGWNSQLIKTFSTYEMILILQLWNWLGPNRRQSMLYQHLGENPTGVHIVFRVADRFSVLDLGKLNGWRKATSDEMKIWREASIKDPSLPKPNDTGVGASKIQRALLRLMMAAMEARTTEVDENLGDDTLQNSVDGATAQGENPDDKPLAEKGGFTADKETVSEEEAFRGNTYETDLLNLTAIIDEDIDIMEEINKSFERYQEPDMAGGEIDQIDGVLPESEQAKLDQSQATDIINTPVGEGDPVTYFPTDADEAFMHLLSQAGEAGNVTVPEYRKLQEANEAFKNIPAPLGYEGTLAEFIEVPEELVAIKESPSIPDRKTVVDKSMLKSSLLDFNERYSSQVLLRDILGMVANLRYGGVVIKDVRVEVVETIADEVYQISIDVKPITGASTTISMRIPVVDKDGNFKINGVKYRTRMQRGDMPIRKIGPDRVALTSYYGKLMIDRSERRVNDYGKWLRDRIRALGMSKRTDIVQSIVPGRAFEPDEKVPRLWSTMAMGLRGFKLKIEESVFTLNLQASTATRFTVGGNDMIEMGEDGAGSRLAMDFNNTMYIVRGDQSFSLAPSIEDLLGLDPLKAPVEYAELKVFGVQVPIAVVLGYLVGFDKSLQMLGAEVLRTVPPGKRLGLAPDEWALPFDDGTLIFSKSNPITTMALAGWRDCDQTTSRFNRKDFNTKDVYFNLFEEKKMSVRYMNELDNLERLFIDKITRGLLEKMEEPQVFVQLLVRACEMLSTDAHPNEQDTMLMRERGYERFAGFAYGEIVKAYRIHNSRPGKHRYGIDVNPYAVHSEIQKDPAKDQIAEINPIQNLKEIEAITYSGTGGRGSRSMVKATRIFHENDRGIASESTVDSSAVAINIFASGDPQFDSLRGTHKKYDFEKQGPTPLLSTSALVSPGSTRDDPKRVNFIGIQNRHVVPCAAYTQPLVRTGYEQVIPYRVGDLFAVMAKQNGKVVSKTKEGIVVEYEDGEQVGVELGRRYGNASGLTIPHNVVSELIEGEAFNAGDAVAYNTGFFERDALNPKQIIYKTALMCKIVLWESAGTLEDSSEISSKLALRLSAEQTKIKDIMVEFGQEIHEMVKEGDLVEPESILCTIEDELSARQGLLDADSLDTLRALSAQTPQAKISGKVERIEVYYNGELEDMSASLRALAEASDERIVARRVSSGRKAFTGNTGDEFRIGTDPLMIDNACIRVYMTANVAAGVGDKGVFFNQMKTVFGRVFNGVIKTEDGQIIDAVFGQKSIDNRIVASPPLIGTTTTLLMVGSQRVVKAYRS